MRFATFSGKEIVLSAHKTKIRNLSSIEEVKQALRYVMTLIGLKSENMPSESQKMVLLDFVQSELSNFTPDEIRLAFKLAASKKLNCDVEHFQNFNAVYIGKIMNCYAEYKGKAMLEFQIQNQKEEKEHEPDEAEKQMLFYQFTDTFIVQKFEKYKSTGILEGTMNGFQAIFKALEETLGFISMSIDEKKEVYQLALDIHKKHVENRKAASKDQAKQFRILAEKVLADGHEATYESEIKKICYEICVKSFYDHCIKEKKDLRTLVEQFKHQQYE
jgi:hypothetical protein